MHNFMGKFVFGLSALITFFTGVILSDNHLFRCRRYSFTSDKVTAAAGKDKVRIISLADLHNQKFGKENGKLVHKLQLLQPDIILIPGDFITVRRSIKMSEALRFMKELTKIAPVYYGLGNHELRLLDQTKHYNITYDEFQKAFTEAGAVLLHNESVCLEDFGIRITGYTVPRAFYSKFQCPEVRSKDVCNMVGKADETKYQILLAHNPEGFPAYAGWGADLTLSGHIHGGLMVLPVLGGFISPKLELFPEYDGGLYTRENHNMVLSRGLGTHTLPIRIFNPGEVTVIDIIDNFETPM